MFLSLLLFSSLVFANSELNLILDTTDDLVLLESISARPEFTKDLKKLAKDKKIPDTKKWAVIVALSKLEGSKTLPLLKEILNKQNPSWYVRTGIAQGLSIIADTRSLEILHEMLNDRSLVVRTVVVDALKNLKDPKSFDLLVNELSEKRNFRGSQSLWIRKHIIDAISVIDGEKAIPIFKGHIEDSDKEVAIRAKKYLRTYN